MWRREDDTKYKYRVIMSLALASTAGIVLSFEGSLSVAERLKLILCSQPVCPVVARRTMVP
jgi:hypothetical protein